MQIAGRYALTQPLGHDVHLAWDGARGAQVFARRVALPRELGDRAREALAQDVVREAAAAARVRHPAAHPVLDAVVHEGEPWIIGPPIAGRPLHDVVAEAGPLTPQAAARIGADVAGALARAHLIGLTHGDVRPGRVWVTAEGRAVLTGFGAGAALREASSVGTPGYTAPELPASPAPAADVWSLGATVYFAVEGVPAFGGDDAMAVLSAVLTAEPRPCARAGDLAPVLGGLLAREAARRPADPGAEFAGLAARERGVPVRASVLAVLAGCAAVAAASVTAIATTLLSSPPPAVAGPPVQGAADPGKFAAAPRACDLLSDERAEELVADFVRSDSGGGSRREPDTYCRVYGSGSIDGRSVVTELYVLKPGPVGDGPATAREFLAGARADAPRAVSSDGTVSPVRDLPGLGDGALAYDLFRPTLSTRATRAVLIVSNVAAVVSCEQKDKTGIAGLAGELSGCAEKAAGWVAEALEKTG
ncbi:protein kinase domain-containing protein [Actinocorallia sp. A-T 12471]|uniref:protein kinase domain-containing protein n=1 Tax=Actinocorallia sp. A-T 12471 TaxID=3089813 RepID=UPI0029D21BAD|nr:hypothetical protein [Actinocorallia sp. A-T 12471]MDX6743919.1 hypothetical protein [Actinocorallia sp. A-T 12471]